MSSSIFITFLLILLIAAPLISSQECFGQKQNTVLHLYVHRIVSGPKVTYFEVVKPNINTQGFGNIGLFDHGLRAGPEKTSQLIGRVQGYAMKTSFSRPKDLFVQETIIFDEGKHKGSTVSYFGIAHEPGLSTYTIMSGEGDFLMPTGWVLSTSFGFVGNTEVINLVVYLKCYGGEGPDAGLGPTAVLLKRYGVSASKVDTEGLGTTPGLLKRYGVSDV